MYCQRLLKLEEQNVIINHLQKLCDVTTIISWQKLCERLPKNIFIFAKKTLVFSLPNNSNLNRCGKSPSDQHSLCQQKQTQRHMLNNCAVSAVMVTSGDATLYWIHYINMYRKLRALTSLLTCLVTKTLPTHFMMPYELT